jgi:hypothetical protein
MSGERQKTYDTSAAAEAQRKFCEEKGYPHFAPRNGICWSCNRNIYEQIEHHNYNFSTGISVESAASGLVTGCPHCYKSYCD